MVWSWPPSRTRCCGTKASEANEYLPSRVRGCAPRCELRYLLDRPWYIRRTHRSIGRHQIHPYRAVRTRTLRAIGVRWFPPITIGEFLLRVLVQIFHVGVRGSAVQVEIVFLHVLAVITLVV